MKRQKLVRYHPSFGDGHEPSIPDQNERCNISCTWGRCSAVNVTYVMGATDSRFTSLSGLFRISVRVSSKTEGTVTISVHNEHGGLP